MESVCKAALYYTDKSVEMTSYRHGVDLSENQQGANFRLLPPDHLDTSETKKTRSCCGRCCDSICGFLFIVILIGSVSTVLYYREQTSSSKPRYEHTSRSLNSGHRNQKDLIRVPTTTNPENLNLQSQYVSKSKEMTFLQTERKVEIIPTNERENTGDNVLKPLYENETGLKNEKQEDFDTDRTSMVHHEQTSYMNHTLLYSTFDLDQLTSESQQLADRNRELLNLIMEKDKELSQVKALHATSDLHDAINQKDYEAIKLLVNSGADVNGTNYKLETPLHRTALSSDRIFALKVIKYLIENGANVYAKDMDGYTFLHRLVDAGTTLTPSQFHDMAAYLISKNCTQLFNTRGSFFKEFKTSRSFLRFRFTTPFQMAVKNLEVEASTLLLLQTNGVNLNVINSDGDSTLFYAILGRRNSSIISTLVELGADWRHLNNKNESLLHRAARFGNVDELKFFLNLGLDINAVSFLGFTPIHLAVYYNTGNVLEMVQLLLKNGANVKIKFKFGRTPLDSALLRNGMEGNLGEVVQLLRDVQKDQ